jgi:metallophosphoesterase (TIGR03767 family)
VPDVTRRSLLLAGVGTLTLSSLGSGLTARARDEAVRLTRSRAFSTNGTTLESAASAAPSAGYRRLVAGPGLPLVVRQDITPAFSARDSTRSALASIVQFTDLHLIDAQSPMRFEFLAATSPSFFRPQEALGTQAAAQLVERVNALGSGPFSGRRFDCVVSTGDNSDNSETLELEWFIRVMSGGKIAADSGSTTEWEGVQNSGDPLYYNPEHSAMDRYKRAGFPRLDGYFSRARLPHSSQGLQVPWYSVFGNHDDSIGGTIPSSWMALEELYTGTTKFTGFASDPANRLLAAAFGPQKPLGLGREAKADTRWQVTADERRAPFGPAEFIAAHLAPSALGAGPVGHGFSKDSVHTGIAYYSFVISPGVTGIALDSTNRAGFTHGSLGHAQFRWLEQTLHTGTANGDLFVLFSHHTTGTMDNPLPDPRNPSEQRHLGPELITLLQQFPNVLALVNGHTHSNSIRPRPGPTPARGFWEINTASHIEFPQQARIIDVCDNGDGTLSLFTTLIESAAPYQASYDDDSQPALAALYRELALNDLNYTGSHDGRPEDHNTELLLVNPLS